MGKDEETEIAVECSVLVFCFFIRCWTFDVRCSMFIFQNDHIFHGSTDLDVLAIIINKGEIGALDLYNGFIAQEE